MEEATLSVEGCSEYIELTVPDKECFSGLWVGRRLTNSRVKKYSMLRNATRGTVEMRKCSKFWPEKCKR
jgi:hypothetical protein